MCVMDTSDPKISFDKNGICDHCENFYKNIKNTINIDQKKKIEDLEKKIININKSTNKENYNCLVGLSGGVDSSYLVHVVVKKLKLKPMVVHVDTGWNSKESVNNIEKIIDKLELDLHTEVINWREMRDLQVAFIKSGQASIEIPQDHAIWASIHKIAIKNNIKYLITGGNLSTECIREPLEWAYHASDVKHIKDIHNKFGNIKLKTFPLCNIFTYRIYYRFFKNLKNIQVLNYFNYKKEDAISILEKEYGWKNYSHKHYESRFTKFWQGYWLRKKFGYDVRKVHFSSLILTGQLTREEALNKLKGEAFDEKEIFNELNYIKTKLGFSDEEFQNYIDAPKKSFKDYNSFYKIIQFLVNLSRFLKLENRLIR
ncbi:N-acetyl sugar amidotransferase [Candidatus Pelagibacter sp.]|nr:N-acetyl sugar amidotransferase [Candidatus Pelagibacter sp.]